MLTINADGRPIMGRIITDPDPKRT